jgi:hypothetical protein
MGTLPTSNAPCRLRTEAEVRATALHFPALPCPSPTQSCPLLGFRVRLSPGIAGCRRPCALSWPCIMLSRTALLNMSPGWDGGEGMGDEWQTVAMDQFAPGRPSLRASGTAAAAAAAAAAATTETSRTPSARWNPPFANDAQILNSFNHDCGIFLSGLSSPRSIPLSGPPRHLPSAAAQSHSSPSAVNLGKRSSSSPRSLDDRC